MERISILSMNKKGRKMPSTVDFGNSKPQNSKLLSKFGLHVENLLIYDLGLVNWSIWFYFELFESFTNENKKNIL